MLTVARFSQSLAAPPGLSFLGRHPHETMPSRTSGLLARMTRSSAFSRSTHRSSDVTFLPALSTPIGTMFAKPTP